MKIAKLILSFTKFSDGNLVNKAGSINQLMTGNPDFPTPAPPLAELTTAIADFVSARIDAATGDKVKIAAKNQARRVLEGVLTQLGMYVMYICNGDVVMLAGSGFDLAKQPEPNPLEQPGVVTVSNGISTGELVARLPRVKGAYSYLYQITPDPYTADSVWHNLPAMASSNTFDNLTPGRRYWIRVGAVGSGSQLAFSPVTSQVAQ